SKESTLQLVYDVLRLTPFFKAFLVTANVLEIYMQEFWATAIVHHHSIRFKMDNKKHIVNLESFREMLHICPRLPSQAFVEPPFKEEIFAFLHFLRHSGAIRRLTDVNINKLHQPWRSFAAIINKGLTGKSSGYDSLRLSQAQILWGLYQKRNVDFAYLMWEDFVYQVEHKDTKKSNKMYYPRNSNAYKEYYAVATGATPPKPKASVRRTRSSSDTIVTPPNAAAGPRLNWFYTGVPDVPTDESEEKISWNSTDEEGDDNDDDEGDDGDDGEKGNDNDDDAQDDDAQDDDDQEDEGNDEDDEKEGSDDEKAFDEEEFTHRSLSTHAEEEIRDKESFDPIPKTHKNIDDEGNGEENLGMNVGREEGQDEEDKEDELYRDVNINLERGIQMGDVHQTQEFEDSHVTLTPVNLDGQQQSSSVSSQFVTMAPLPMSAPTLTPSTIATITTTQQSPIPLTIAPSTLLQDLPNFSSLFGFDHRLKTLETNFSEFMQTNQFAGAVSSIPGIVQIYMDQRMNEAVKVAIQIQSDRLRDEAQAENDEFLKTIDENMQKIIKEQVKEQVKVQVSKILPKIEQTVNEQLEAEVLTRSSNSSKTSYVVAADLSKMELKKILIEKIEGNKSIQRSNEQRKLYKALVEAYDSDKIILDTYGDMVTLKRRRDDDADKDEEPSVGPDRGSKRRREGKEPDESATTEEPMQATFEMEDPSHPEFETGADDQPIVEPSQHLKWFSQQKKPPTLYCDWNKTLPATHESIQPWISELTKKSDSRSSFNELMDTPGSCKSLVELEFFLEEVYKATTGQLEWVNPEGQQYLHNLLKPLLLILNNRGRHVITFDHFINNDLEYIRGGASSHKYTTSVTKTKQHITGTSSGLKTCSTVLLSARDVYSKRRIIAVIEIKIVEGHNYKYLDGIMVCRDDDKLYKFKEADFKRLRIQDIEDIIVIQRRMEDLQLGVKSYQKKLNLPKPDTYCSDLKHKEAYIAYSNLRGFIYQNKDKQNRLMRIDELHKFNDGILTDVRTALDDHLKGIRMKYLPQSIWRKSDKDRAASMIQAIDKRLKTRRIMRSLKRSILTDLQVIPTKPGQMTMSYSSYCFIAKCFNARNLKMEVKVKAKQEKDKIGSKPDKNEKRHLVVSPRMWWRIFLQQKNHKFLMLCPPVPLFN
nr:hypothetical protein [Tanacetum cinerariifolium]